MKTIQLSIAKSTPPKLNKDYYSRSSLVKKINHKIINGHVFIHAPSGFGKTSLMVEFCNTKKLKPVWVSISNNENSFIPFLIYLSHALNRSGVELIATMRILKATHLVDSVKIEEQFLIDLENWPKGKLIVFDDFHLINNKEVLNFIWNIIKRCSDNIRILISSRVRLPVVEDWQTIPLLTIIEPKELQFSPEEYLKYKESLTHSSTYNDNEYQEGWIAGINISLKKPEILRSQSTVELIKNAIYEFENPEYIYLIASLDMFNSELCRIVLGNDKIIDQLLSSSIILIQIDAEIQHFRLHHFCQDIINEHVPSEVLPALRILQIKTIKYYINKGFFVEAFEIAKKFKLKDLEYQSFLLYRLECFNNSNLYALQELFRSVQNSNLLSDVENQLNLAWLDVFKGDTLSMIHKIDEINLKHIPEFLISEYYVLKAYSSYIHSRFKDVLNETNHIITSQTKNLFALGYMHIFKIGGLQCLKRSNEAFAHGISTLALTNESIIKCQVLLGMCYISRLEARQQNQFDYAHALLALSEEERNIEGIVNASSFIGEYYFNRAEYKSAEKVLKKVLEFKENTIGVIGMSFSTLYASVLFATGKKNQAVNYINKEIEQYIVYGNGFLTPYLESLRAEFLFMSHNKDEALFWAKEIQVDTKLALTESYSTILGKLRILLSKPLQFPTNILNKLISSLLNANNKRYLAECHLIECCLNISVGNYAESHSKLRDILNVLPLIKFRGIYETYIFYCPELESLINKYTNNIDSISISKQLKITNRENQIIDLYVHQLTDQEMANQLGISVSTIKRHNVNIFNKLQVSSKRQVLAVLKN